MNIGEILSTSCLILSFFYGQSLWGLHFLQIADVYQKLSSAVDNAISVSLSKIRKVYYIENRVARRLQEKCLSKASFYYLPNYWDCWIDIGKI